MHYTAGQEFLLFKDIVYRHTDDAVSAVDKLVSDALKMGTKELEISTVALEEKISDKDFGDVHKEYFACVASMSAEQIIINRKFLKVAEEALNHIESRNKLRNPLFEGEYSITCVFV